MVIYRLCRLFGVSSSGFYSWLHRPVSAHKQYDEELKHIIRELHQGYRRSYGAPRLHQELKRGGFSCSVRRVNRLMREMGVKTSTTGLYVWRPGHQRLYSSAGNQRPHIGKPMSLGEQWVGDFTHIKTAAGWLYHAVVIDLFSRRVIGASFSKRRNSELTKRALMNALEHQRPKPQCMFHSDQGIEYAAHEYRELLESNGFVRSMSRKATPLDNAEVESFFHTMKAELVHQKSFSDAIEAVANIAEYIAFYNKERIHSSLEYQSPENYEKLYA